MEIDCTEIDAEMVKDMAFKYKNELSKICFVAHGVQNGKVLLTLLVGDDLVVGGKDASTILRQAAKEVKGGGGGQKHYATVHVVTNANPHEIKHHVRDELKKYGIIHATIELESEDEHCHEQHCHVEVSHTCTHHHHHH